MLNLNMIIRLLYCVIELLPYIFSSGSKPPQIKFKGPKPRYSWEKKPKHRRRY